MRAARGRVRADGLLLPAAGGLVVGLALTARYLAGGRRELGAAAPFDAGVILGVGLLTAASTAVIPLFFGVDALTSTWFTLSLGIFGEIDLVTSIQNPDSLAQFEDNADFTVSEGTSTTKELLAFNDRVAPFDDALVRKAVYSAIDREQLLTSGFVDYSNQDAANVISIYAVRKAEA